MNCGVATNHSLSSTEVVVWPRLLSFTEVFLGTTWLCPLINVNCLALCLDAP